MHELSLLNSVVQAIQRSASAAQVTQVTQVCLRVGSMSGAVPEALQGSWPIATADTICQGATLTLELIAATVYCPSCEKDVEIDQFFALLCPVCDTPTANLTHGREFALAWVEWDT